MEFKFSCKWFGIEFSGDPGYVESQLQKYEPYVLNALKLVDQEQKREEEPKPVREQSSQPRPPQPQPQPHPQPPPPGGDRMRPPEQTRQWDRQPRFDQRPPQDDRRGIRPEQQRPSPGGPGQDPRADQKKNEAPPQPVPIEAEEITRAAVSEGVSSELIYDALAGKGASGLPAPGSGPEALAGAEPIAPALGESERALAVDFPLRRRTPRVREDELARIIEQKKPRTHHDRVMVFGYYMENAGGGSDFTGPEIKRCYEAANLDPGMNIEQVINHATRSGFIVRFDKGRVVRYKLSAKGKRYVADGLRLA